MPQINLIALAKATLRRLAPIDQRASWLIPLVVFAALSAILFREAFLFGYVLDGNWDRRDQGLPFHEFARQQFAQGRLPTWNPYIFCGSSFLFSTANLSLYPPNWIAYACPARWLPSALTFIVLGHMVLSGILAYALLRISITDRFLSAAFAIGFMLSSAMVMNAATEMSYYGLVLIPANLFLMGSLTQRKPLVSLVLLATTFSAIIVSGVANMVIYGLAVSVAYAGYHSLFCCSGKDGLKQAIIVGSSLLMALGVTAVRTLPFFYDAAFYLKEKVPYASFLDTGMTPWQCSLRLFMPHFFGDKTYPTLVHPLLQESLGREVPGVMNNFEAFNCYSGVIPAVFFLYACVFVWSRSAVFWKIATAVTLITVFGGPLAYVHYHLTGRTNVHFGRLAMLLPAYVAVLAGMAAVRVFGSRKELRRFTFFTLATLVVIGILSELLLRHIETLVGASRHSLPFATAAQRHFGITGATLAGLILYASWRGPSCSLTLVKVLTLGIATVDSLVIAGVDRNFSRQFMAPVGSVVVDPQAIPLPENATTVKRYRALTLGSGIHGCTSIWLNAYNVSGLDQSAPDVISSLYWYPKRPRRMDSRSIWPQRSETMHRVLQLTSACCVTLDDRVMEVERPLPRWSLYNDYIVALTADDELEQSVSNLTNIHRRVVLNAAPTLEISGKTPRGTASLISEHSDEITLSVECDKASILLLTDTYYPGWNAYVNGATAPIMRANAAFRAVAVPSGRSTVVFRFVHPRVPAGLAISLASSVILASLACLTVLPLSKSSDNLP